MIPLSLVIVVPLVCWIGAYGIQKRRKWAWYAGLIFQFFSAAALGSYLAPDLLGLPFELAEAAEPFAWWNVLRVVAALLGSAGAVALWVGWAAWWAHRRADFGIERER